MSNNKKKKEPRIKIYVLLIIPFIVWGAWAWFEMVMYGEVQPREVDTIIGMFWVMSIYVAYKYMIEFEQLSLLHIESLKQIRELQNMANDLKNVVYIINSHPVCAEDVEILLEAYVDIIAERNLHDDTLKKFLKETMSGGYDTLTLKERGNRYDMEY